ncbi:PAS modulated sigma54 specific transcriptional regulator, Fis family [Desulfamplus magnetovallimortis]|uniref:PAS modulated sigma54 specific transcriptional regulator, Fis family n=1 Tax=Desulfamplus magnetovallimortis TaxID=1246637 RepID=A0A1W1HJN9_9BACT|nr:sigma 54-interacting transcriptional regulator [Desulfamplus magnetovallimortis]SLM32592.1 PAS modulated sigma54 specific transcriptional regulator, Fis family [Desulfamplus magnetovallimortis]
MSSGESFTKEPYHLQSVTEIILESISDGVFTVDPDWKITSFNRAAEKITGIDREEAIGRHCWDVFRSNMCERECALKKTMKEGKPFVNSDTHIVSSEGEKIPVTVSTSVLKDSNGNSLGGVEIFRDHTLVDELRKALSSRFQMGEMLSRNPVMQQLFDIIPLIAESDSSVLIEGESGTGKELVAKAIHDKSPRNKSPFVAINCGALPDSLLESELFGYKAGAFTNASKDKAGYFASAQGGTIFLDEIGETSAAFQVRLLRVLEEKAFQPLGTTEKVESNVRVITATNRNLLQMVAEKDFRRDLFYRINVVQVFLPPLRERMEDIPLLVKHFISRMNTIQGKMVEGIEPDALETLMKYPFYGNIRELQNLIEHAFVLCSSGFIALKHFPAILSHDSSFISTSLSPSPSSPLSTSSSSPSSSSPLPSSPLSPLSPLSSSSPSPPLSSPPQHQQSSFKDSPPLEPTVSSGFGSFSLSNNDNVQAAQREIIFNALINNNYNRKAAAKELGIHKSTLFRKIKKLGIILPKGVDGRSS